MMRSATGAPLMLKADLERLRRATRVRTSAAPLDDVHTKFLNHFGLSSSAVPLVIFDSRQNNAPFRLVDLSLA